MQLIARHSRGFTLIEMTFVLMIIAMIATGGLALLARNVEREKVEITTKRIQTIMEAVEQYAHAFGHLPCPAANNVALDGETFGRADGSEPASYADGSLPPSSGADNCTADFVDIEYNTGADDVMVVGMVPITSLGLPPIYTLDGWNRKFTFAVDENLTVSDDYANTSIHGDIQMVDEGGDSLIGDPTVVQWPSAVVGADFDPETQGAAAVVISHGPNGHGAVRAKTGNIITLASPGDAEVINAVAAGTTMTGVFSIVPFNESNVPAGSYFDDIIDFRAKWQLP